MDSGRVSPTADRNDAWTATLSDVAVVHWETGEPGGTLQGDFTADYCEFTVDSTYND